MTSSVSNIDSLLRAFVLSLLACTAGCAKRHETSAATLPKPEKSYVLTILVDLSGSFQHLMAEDGKAYDFALAVIDQFGRDRDATFDKIVFAQISGSQSGPLLWEGTPAELRRDFASAAKFREFLLSKADPYGSFVHDGLVETLNYVSSDPAVANGQAKTALFVLSDMLDNGPDSSESERRAVRALSTFGKQGGIVGMYYVDQRAVPVWRRHLQEAAVREFRVECQIVGRPDLPSFETP